MDNPLRSAPSIAGSWESLNPPLTPWILDVVHSMGFNRMTPVQASTIPLFMKNKDVVVEAVTGSGKTLAFVIPIIERLVRPRSEKEKLKPNEVGALIISPTRELATQIHAVFNHFLSSQLSLLSPPSHPPAPEVDPSLPGYLSNRTPTPPPPPEPEFPLPLLLVSGPESSPQKDLRRFLESGADIVVGTPGRIEEFLLGRGRNVVSVKRLEVVVLDEADRLLDLGFAVQLTKILNHLPKQRRSGLFSATMTEGLSEIVRVGLRNPVRIVVKVETKSNKKQDPSQKGKEERRTPATLQNTYIMIHPSEKSLQLLRLLLHERNHGESRFIVYFATCAAVTYFAKIFALLPQVEGFSFHPLHGHLPPSARTASLNAFATHASSPLSPAVLLCTDVAARGLDLPSVDVVIQFDAPLDPKVFSHRCGRTARAGREGKGVILLCGRNNDGVEGEESWGREGEYVPFLAVRKIPLKERPFITSDDVEEEIAVTPEGEEKRQTSRPDPAAQYFKRQIQELVLKDRDLNEKGIVAFVSFVRAYTKHEASYIFRVQDLDLIGVATSYGLLRLPKMPELKGVNREVWEDVDYNDATYAYASKAREAARIAKLPLAKTLDERIAEHKARREKKLQAVSWSKTKAKQVKKREKKAQRKAWKERVRKLRSGEVVINKGESHGQQTGEQANDGTDTDEAKTKPGGVDAGNKRPLTEEKVADEEADDWDALEREEREAKRQRRGAGRAISGTFNDLGGTLLARLVVLLAFNITVDAVATAATLHLPPGYHKTLSILQFLSLTHFNPLTTSPLLPHLTTMSFSASIDTVAFNDPHAIPVRATVFDTDAELSLEEACLSTRWPPSSLPPIPRIVNPGLTPSGAEIIKSVRIAFRYALEQVRWDHGRKDTAMYYSYRTQVLNDALAQADQQYSSYAEWVDVRAKLCVEFSLGGTVPTQAGSLDAAPANSRHNSSTVSMVASNAIQSPRPSPAEQYATERSERMPCATSPPEDVSSLFQDYFHGADSMAPCLSRGEDALSRCRSHSTLRVCKDVRPRPEFSSFFEAGSFIKAVLTSPNRDANSPAMSKSFSTPSESLTWGSLPASSCRPTVTTNDVAVHISMPEGASLASKRRDALRRANSADQVPPVDPPRCAASYWNAGLDPYGHRPIHNMAAQMSQTSSLSCRSSSGQPWQQLTLRTNSEGEEYKSDEEASSLPSRQSSFAGSETTVASNVAEILDDELPYRVESLLKTHLRVDPGWTEKREAEWLKKRLRQMVEGDVEDIEGVIDLSPAADLANQWPHGVVRAAISKVFGSRWML